MFASGKAIAWMTFKATKEMRRNKDCAAGPIERRVLASTSVPRLIGFVQKMHQSISVHHLKYKIHSHKYKMHSHKYKINCCHKYKINSCKYKIHCNKYKIHSCKYRIHCQKYK